MRYFSEVYNSITTLSNAVQETPSDVALWIKLARLQMCQKTEEEEEDNEEQTDSGVLQSLNTLSRGLEANPGSEVFYVFIIFVMIFFNILTRKICTLYSGENPK